MHGANFSFNADPQSWFENGGKIVKGSVHLFRSPTITCIPDDVTIHGHCAIWDCGLFASVGQNVKVIGSMSISNCKNFQTIGNNLTVSGVLRLRNCPEIKTLPQQLRAQKIVLENTSITPDDPVISYLLLKGIYHVFE